MRTHNLTSMLFATLFCCFFSISLSAQNFFSKLDKISQTVEKSTQNIRKVNNSVQNVRREVAVFTGEVPKEETTNEPDQSATTDSGSTGNRSTASVPASPKNNTNNSQVKALKGKQPTLAVKVPSGQSKNVSINGSNAIVRNMLGSYTIQVLDCQGNSGDQTVTITFLVEHNVANQSLYIYPKDTRAYAKGQDYTNIDRFIGSRSFNNVVPTDIPMECRVVIRNVVSSVKSFDSVILNMKTQNKDGGRGDQKGTLEMKNLNIQWN